MKKNILSATMAFILACVLFFIVSTTNYNNSTSLAATSETIESSISETYIPSEQTIVFEQLNGKVFTAGAIEIKTMETIEVKPVLHQSALSPTKKPVVNPIVKEETTTIKQEEMTTVGIVEETTTEIVEETTETSTTEKTTHIEETTVKSEEDIWAKRSAEYPTATYIWLYMKDLGWSDAVCAGIMGNMMAEVGGQTLSINPYLYGYDSYGTYYGICQWYLPYASGLKGASLEAQCNYLRDTIKKEMNTFGYKYSGSMNYSNFLTLSSPSEAALCFAKCYERCASFSYNIRKVNAEKAYDYFVG